MTQEEMQKQIESMMPTPQQIVEHIDKELEEEREQIVHNILRDYESLENLLSFIDTLEVKKTDEDNSLEKFKSLQHISGDFHQTLEDWGYAPNLYFFDGMWHVSWISCEEGDGIKDFEGSTPEEAIDKAYNWFHATFCNG